MAFILGPQNPALGFLREVSTQFEIHNGFIVVAWARRVWNRTSLFGPCQRVTQSRCWWLGWQDAGRVLKHWHTFVLFHADSSCTTSITAKRSTQSSSLFDSGDSPPSNAALLVGSSNLTGGGLFQNIAQGIWFLVCGRLFSTRTWKSTLRLSRKSKVCWRRPWVNNSPLMSESVNYSWTDTFPLSESWLEDERKTVSIPSATGSVVSDRRHLHLRYLNLAFRHWQSISAKWAKLRQFSQQQSLRGIRPQPLPIQWNNSMSAR